MSNTPIDIDMRKLAVLCRLQCTDEEIAAVFNCSSKTIQRHKADPVFQATMNQGVGEGKCSLRRMQWKSAKNGNVAMQIFLGKQYLGQSDKLAQGEMDKNGNLTDAASIRAKMLAGSILDASEGDAAEEDSSSQ